MLHELLLALSGHPSPLFPRDSSSSAAAAAKSQLSGLLSPSEASLVASLATLGDQHQSARSLANAAAASHHSIVCRAVAAAVVRQHLAAFQDRIVEVERGILSRDAGLVGAYDIVPLSGVVGKFDGWKRIFDWLLRLLRFLHPRDDDDGEEREEGTRQGLEKAWPQRKNGECSGAQVIDWLRRESRTGHPDIERVSLSLVRVAETTWLRQLTSWLLYGRLPKLGGGDFFIRTEEEDDDKDDEGHLIANETSSLQSYHLVPSLLPAFVSPSTASSVLFVGRSLNRIQGRAFGAAPASMSDEEWQSLLSSHLQTLFSLDPPISATAFSRAVSDIRSSLARNALRHLLPVDGAVRLFDTLHAFFLLGRPGFAVALVDAADECLERRRTRQVGGVTGGSVSSFTPVDLRRLGGVMLREAEVGAVLNKAWATLAAAHDANTLAADEDQEDTAADEQLDTARDSIRLSTLRTTTTTDGNSKQRSVASAPIADTDADTFADSLLAIPTVLTITPAPPLDALFLPPRAVAAYARIHAYLLAAHRAHAHLTGLWGLAGLRRTSTVLARPSVSLSLRVKARQRRTRAVWATAVRAAAFFAALGAYFQGEVVAGSARAFREWMVGPVSEKTTTTLLPTRLKDVERTRASSNEKMDDEQENDKVIEDARNVQNRIGGPSSDDSPNDSLHRAKAQPSSKPSEKPPSSVAAPASAAVVVVAEEDHQEPRDPESLSLGHATFLSALAGSLLLTDPVFSSALRTLISRCDELVAQLRRLAALREAIDALSAGEDDDGEDDDEDDQEDGDDRDDKPHSAIAALRREEREVVRALDQTRRDAERTMDEAVRRLRALDADMDGDAAAAAAGGRDGGAKSLQLLQQQQQQQQQGQRIRSGSRNDGPGGGNGNWWNAFASSGGGGGGGGTVADNDGGVNGGKAGGRGKGGAFDDYAHVHDNIDGVHQRLGSGGFVPWQGGGVERLLIRLDPGWEAF